MTTDPDDLARHAARTFRAGIDDAVDLDAAHARSVQPRPRVPYAVAAFAIVAIAAALVFARPDGGDVELAVDEDEPTSTTTIALPDVDEGRSVALGPAAPDDGKDSVGLPVTAEPSAGLVDGQTVTVTGSGFPANESVGVVMCAREAGRDYGGRGAEACNLNRYASATSDAQGVATVEFRVQRVIVLDGQEIDCASEPARCLIGMGLISDYDQSGGVLVDFDPSVPLPDPPTVELDQTEQLRDGQRVGTRIEGLVPDAGITISQCDDAGTCAQTGYGQADGNGVFAGDVTVYRLMGAYGSVPTNLDCADTACSVRFDAEAPAARAVPPVPVTFVVTDGDPVAPTMHLPDDGPFELGDVVDVEVRGLPQGFGADAILCTPDFAICGGGIDADLPRDGVSTIRLQLEGHEQGLCTGRCVIVSGVWPIGDVAMPTSYRPPLHPVPVEVLITG